MKFAIKAALFIIPLTLLSCNNSNQSTGSTPPQVAGQAKRYHLKGKIVSVDKRAKMLNVDGEAIPGFMSAMTMPYNVKPEAELDKLSSGDSITADVVVQEDNAWLENVAVTAHSNASPSK
ncbi:MAG TPA: copper-binding protein [Terriglobales bacterium]|nr:copper-binding protein [Terriglobales bacterium]